MLKGINLSNEFQLRVAYTAKRSETVNDYTTLAQTNSNNYYSSRKNFLSDPKTFSDAKQQYRSSTS